ncbi:MAG: zinc ribbon domain-containing protein [Planctomycetota bacterium]
MQQFLEYMPTDAGIQRGRVPPPHTSRRCSRCGYINQRFDRATHAAWPPSDGLHLPRGQTR